MAEIVEEVIPVIPDKIDVPPEPSKELTGRGIILAIILRFLSLFFHKFPKVLIFHENNK